MIANKKIIVLVLVLAVGLTSCQQAQETMDMGAVLPMTGSLAFLGDDYKNSLEMAVEEINAHGGIDGKTVVLHIEDGKADPTTSLSAARSLVQNNNAQVVFTAFRGASMAISSGLESQNVIIMANTATSQNGHIGTETFFPIGSEMVAAGEIVGTYITENDLCESLALLSEDTDAGRDKLIGVKNGFSEISSEQYVDPAANDFRTVLLKASEADCLFFELRNTKTPVFLRQMQELGIEMELFANSYVLTEETIEQSPENIQGLIFSSNRFSEETNEKAAHYIEAYEDIYGSAPSEFGAALYDAAYIIDLAAESCGSFDTGCISSEIRAIGTYQGVLGVERISKHSDILLDDYVLKEVPRE